MESMQKIKPEYQKKKKTESESLQSKTLIHLLINK